MKMFQFLKFSDCNSEDKQLIPIYIISLDTHEI